MSTDSWNKDYPESKPAVDHALAALQEAINATCWMGKPCPTRNRPQNSAENAHKPPAHLGTAKALYPPDFSCTHEDSRNQPTGRTQLKSCGT